MANEPDPLSRDVLFDVLSNSRRRAALCALRRRGDLEDVAELADVVTTVENGVALSEVAARERKRVYVSLYQTHVPKLEAHGLVERDDEAIRATDRAERLDRYLPAETRDQRLDRRLCAGLAGAALGSVPLVAIDAFPVGTHLAFATIAIAAGVVAVAQFTRRRSATETVPEEVRARGGQPIAASACGTIDE